MAPQTSHRYPTGPRPLDARASLREMSIDMLMHYLRDIDYPAPRDKLIAKALENGAPGEVLERLHTRPETAEFRTEEDVRRAYGAG